MTNLQGVPPLLAMRGHVDWKMSHRTVHCLTEHSQLETPWAADMKAIIFWKKLWRRFVCCRVFCLQCSQKEAVMAGGGDMKQDEIRIDRVGWKKTSKAATKKWWQKAVSGSFYVGVWLHVSERLCAWSSLLLMRKVQHAQRTRLIVPFPLGWFLSPVTSHIVSEDHVNTTGHRNVD